MFLAQQLSASGMPKVALSYAYDVLQAAKNDPDAALRYFGLMMLDPNGRHTPRPREVGSDDCAAMRSRRCRSRSTCQMTPAPCA